MAERKEIKLTGKAAALFLVAALLIMFVNDLILGWILMLVLGAIHSQNDSVPAYSYWVCFLISVGVSFVAGLFKRP